jgi:hypothetical protein
LQEFACARAEKAHLRAALGIAISGIDTLEMALPKAFRV